MEGLGGGGISFIKRVSVKGFLFLPSPPPPNCPWSAFGSEAAGTWQLPPGGRAMGPLSFPAACSLHSPPVPLGGGRCGLRELPAAGEPARPGYWGPSWQPCSKWGPQSPSVPSSAAGLGRQELLPRELGLGLEARDRGC